MHSPTKEPENACGALWYRRHVRVHRDGAGSSHNPMRQPLSPMDEHSKLSRRIAKAERLMKERDASQKARPPNPCGICGVNATVGFYPAAAPARFYCDAHRPAKP